MNLIKKEIKGFTLLLRSVPAHVASVFVLAVLVMNLMANRSITLPFNWLVLDGGFFFSWAVFLTMDIITRHFGPKAATQLTVFAAAINMVLSAMLYIITRLPGSWGEAYITGSEAIINTALNNTFGGTWYIILGSMAAFIISAFVNNYSNHFIGRLLKSKDKGFSGYAARTYISTALGQFTDNMVFALLVSRGFFGWTLTQCVSCSLIGMLAELLCEVLFSYWGYTMTKRWKKENVGEVYLSYTNGGHV